MHLVFHLFMFPLSTFSYYGLITVRLLKLGHLEKHYPITTFFGKQKIFKFFCKQTDSIHKFEGCFLRGQVSSNGFKVFNGCIVEYLNFIGPFAKKLENLFFSKTL